MQVMVATVTPALTNDSETNITTPVPRPLVDLRTIVTNEQKNNGKQAIVEMRLQSVTI